MALDGVIDSVGLDVFDPVRTELLLWTERDEPIDGFVDWTASRTWTADGEPVRFEQDDDADGQPDFSYEFTRDAEGRAVGLTYDIGGDGTIDFEQTIVYDPEGRVASLETEGSAVFAIPYSYVTYTYDTDGRLLSSEEDLDQDGIADVLYTYTYDDDTRTTEVEGDIGLDGTIDSLRIFTHPDPSRDLEHETFDEDNDGIVDYVSETEYDAEGRFLSLVQDSTPDDGVWEYEEHQSWDPVTGNLLTEDFLSDYQIYAAEYTYDATARVVSVVSRTEDLVSGSVVDALDTLVYGGTCP